MVQEQGGQLPVRSASVRTADPRCRTRRVRCADHSGPVARSGSPAHCGPLAHRGRRVRIGSGSRFPGRQRPPVLGRADHQRVEHALAQPPTVGRADMGNPAADGGVEPGAPDLARIVGGQPDPQPPMGVVHLERVPPRALTEAYTDYEEALERLRSLVTALHRANHEVTVAFRDASERRARLDWNPAARRSPAASRRGRRSHREVYEQRPRRRGVAEHRLCREGSKREPAARRSSPKPDGATRGW